MSLFGYTSERQLLDALGIDPNEIVLNIELYFSAGHDPVATITKMIPLDNELIEAIKQYRLVPVDEEDS